MRKVFLAFVVVIFLGACNGHYRKVEGNGVLETKEKSLTEFDELEVSGDFKVTLYPSDEYKVIVEAEENLQPYILVEEEGDRLKIRMKNHINIRSTRGIKVKVFTKTLKRVEMAGSGAVQSGGLLENENGMQVTIAGSGDANLEVKTPEMKASIGGSGKVVLRGKTRNLKVSIAGSGDYQGDQFMSEDAEINIAGSGNARVYASMILNISIAGSGDVYYYGAPKSIKKSIAGSGNIKAME